MNAITEFNFHTHSVRVFPTDDATSFVAIAADVAEALEYESAKDMLRCVDEEDKGWAEVPTLGGIQRMRTINESGIYTATFRSRKQSAKPFRRWVTADVLPSIRKTGSYRQQTHLPATLTPEQYEAERDRLDDMQDRLAATPITITPAHYEQLTGEHVRVAKKTWLIVDLVALFEEHDVPREVTEKILGINNNTIRQHAFRARKHGQH